MSEAVKEFVLPSLIGLAIAGGIIWGGYMLINRATDFGPQVAGAFHAGQMVRMGAFSHTGMVIRVRCPFQKFGSVCRYDVRFPAMQLTTDVRLFGGDGPIQFAPVALVRGIYEFELRRIP